LQRVEQDDKVEEITDESAPPKEEKSKRVSKKKSLTSKKGKENTSLFLVENFE
jgi:hypothetical protein